MRRKFGATRLKRLSRDQDGRSEALHGVVASGID
jgi:hypothetical protein